MCGFFQFTENKKFKEFLNSPSPIPDLPTDLLYGEFAPSQQINIIHQVKKDIIISKATWWLLLDNNTRKPNYKYASFNSRYDKMNLARSIAYKPYRESRCIIPATGFVEGRGDKKHFYLF